MTLPARRQTVGSLISEKVKFDPTLYYALIDGGFYLSFRQEPLKDLIDRRGKKEGPSVEVSSLVFVAPQAMKQTRSLVRLYLEWETHRRAQRSERLLYALYHSGVVGPQDSHTAVEDAALQYLGFVPVSPDLAPFHYDAKKDEVVKQRHGSWRRPRWDLTEATPAEHLLLEQLRTLRAHLRFREDGIHTTVTLKRNMP